MKVILLAAGYATRLYPLTQNCPKALLPIGERLLLDLLLDSVRELQGVTSLSLVTNARFERQFQVYADKLLAQGYPYPLQIFSDGTQNEGERLGALGDLVFVLDRVGWDEDTLVLASDNLISYSLRKAQKVFEARQADLLLGQRIPSLAERRRFGIAEIDEEGRVLRMEEKSENPISEWAVYATYFYRASSLQLLREYLANGGEGDSPGHFPVWLAQRVPVYLHAFEGESIDIGTPESYEAVRQGWRGRDSQAAAEAGLFLS